MHVIWTFITPSWLRHTYTHTHTQYPGGRTSSTRQQASGFILLETNFKLSAYTGLCLRIDYRCLFNLYLFARLLLGAMYGHPLLCLVPLLTFQNSKQLILRSTIPGNGECCLLPFLLNKIRESLFAHPYQLLTVNSPGGVIIILIWIFYPVELGWYWLTCVS